MTYRVNVTHTIGDFANDLASIPVKFASEAPVIVRRNVEQGNKLAQANARARSGPHGRLYYKRLTGEMTGLMRGEYGPHGDPQVFVGAGYRSGAPNLDLPLSADVIGPKLAKDVRDLLDRLFW